MIFALGAKGEGYYVSAESAGIRPALLTGQLDDDFRKLALDATVAVGDELPKSNVLQLEGRQVKWLFDQLDFEGTDLDCLRLEFVAGAKVAVELTPKKDEKDFTHVDLVQAQRRMMSPDYYLPVNGHYRFEVRPVECFGKKGAPIVSSVVNVQE